MEPRRPPEVALDLTRIENLPALYTGLYSARAFDQWRRLFGDSAMVIRLDGRGKPVVMGIDHAAQRFARFAANCGVLHEAWDEVDIRTEGRLAIIRARYRLTSDLEIREGTDLLTVVREGDDWKIACLAYEQTLLTPRPPQAAGPAPACRTAAGEPARGTNLADGLTDQANRQPDAVAIRTPGRELTFRELELLTWRCAALLAAHQVAAGDAVALSFSDELAGVVSLLATARRGATVWWIPQTTATQHRQLVVGSGARVVLSDGPPEDGFPVLTIRPDLSTPGASDAPTAGELRDPSPKAPWLVITGSGSTGTPKRIPITHSQYLAQRCTYNKALALGPADRVASLLSLDSVLKRERFLDALLTGASLVLGGGHSTDPIRWLHESAVSILWTTVVQAERLLAAPRLGKNAALPSLRAFIVGSSSVSEKLRRRILAGLTPNLHVYYGTNEVGLISMTRPKDLLASAQTVGYLAPGVRLEIVDDQDRILPAGHIGLVRLRSPGMAGAYLDDPAASQRAFRDGWFHPSDLGRMAPDGRLDFCGRADHMMILDGTNIYPEEIEWALLSHPGVADAAAMPLHHEARQDIPVCAVALETGASVTEQELMRHAREHLGFRGPRAVVVLERIPRNEQGKLIRQELGRELAGRLAATMVQTVPSGPPVTGTARNLTFDLLDHARSTPDAPALLLANGPMSYRQVNDAVWLFCQHLHEQGLRAGDVLGLTIADELTLVLTLLAVIRLGATAFSIPRSATPTQRRDMAARAGIKALATDQPGDFDVDAPLLLVDQQAVATVRRGIDTGILAATPDGPWLLITGSGTTGQPKLIPVTHGQTAARSRAATASLHVTSADRVTSLSHFDFSTSKFRLHEALSVGAAYALRVWNSTDPIGQLQRQSISVVYATVFHAETLLAKLPPAAGSALGTVRVLELTASTVSDDLRQRIRRLLCPNLHVRYGINEAGPVCIAHPPEVFTVSGTVGRPLPGTQVQVVDGDERPVSAGTVGLIRIRSPGVVEGYRDNEEATRQSFRDGWFKPGDLGRFTPGGELIYCGRADHMMIINGINIYPAEIEDVMTAHPDVHDAAVVPLRHAVHQDVPICAVTLHPGASATEHDLLAYARERLGSHGPHRVLVFDRIPRNHDAKLVRAEMSELITRRLAGVGTPAIPPRGRLR